MNPTDAHRDVHSSALLAARQRRVHEMIQSVGGYWRPINAVARVLEELAELAEQLDDTEAGHSALAQEFADLWIISTCLANQFCIVLTDRRTRPAPNADFGRLVRAAGEIARVVNYYDGPKAPKASSKLPSLAETIHDFHELLADLASAHGVDLGGAVDAKTSEARSRDRGRFESGYDPSTATSLTAMQPLLQSTQCLFAKGARLWGAPEWDTGLTMKHNAGNTVPFLTSFVKAAQSEQLDGFVIRLPREAYIADMSDLSRYFAHLLTALSAQVPDSHWPPAADLLTPAWQYSFRGVRLFISVFSPLYGPSHPRHCADDTFVLFQPENSFDQHRIGSKFATADATRTKIRRAFLEAGKEYPADLIDSRIEARIYLPPRHEGDEEVTWWKNL